MHLSSYTWRWSATESPRMFDEMYWPILECQLSQLPVEPFFVFMREKHIALAG